MIVTFFECSETFFLIYVKITGISQKRAAKKFGSYENRRTFAPSKGGKETKNEVGKKRLRNRKLV